jgi:hypothetical protein
MARSYRILDEPAPGKLANLSVNPFWPILALMLGGAWVGWPWLALNSLAIGSASQRRELFAIAAGWLSGALLLSALIVIDARKLLDPRWLPYLKILIPALKLSFGYAVFHMQERSFELYEYFGGRVRNGAFVVVAAFLLTPNLFKAVGDSFWRLVLA